MHCHLQETEVSEASEGLERGNEVGQTGDIPASILLPLLGSEKVLGEPLDLRV
jgi:hypothetical protein